MKRRILLVDDEVAVLLTLKAVLEISGFDVDTATSAREGKARIRHREYEMVITDMRMEGDRAGEEVITEARNAPYRPAVALLTAFPLGDAEWQDMGADKMLVKPMHTRALLQQLEALFLRREKDKGEGGEFAPTPSATPVKKSAAKPVKKSAAKRSATKVSSKKAVKKAVAKKAVAKKVAPAKKAVAKKAVAKKAVAKKAVAKKTVTKKVASKKTAAKRR